jgi:hypothetical protein
MPQLFQWLEPQPTWSDFPLILLATKRTERRPKHALDLLERLGNIAVLERPLNAETLRRAVSSALRARLRQYEARRQLAERVEAQERLHLALAAGRPGSWNWMSTPTSCALPRRFARSMARPRGGEAAEGRQSRLADGRLRDAPA